MNTSPNIGQFNLRNPVHLLATGFGSGCIPFAPGTWGTLAAIPFYWLASMLTPAWYLSVVALMIVAGIGLCGRTASNLNTHDHPGIVWDEFAGFFITMSFAPPGWLWIAAGFVLFRLFDILKPWPVGQIDASLKSGLGIMADDIVAGLYAWLCLQGLVFFWG